jgi:hypothetical protein
MAEGWIALHRRITEHLLWSDKPFSKGQAWIDMLLEANHEERKFFLGGHVIICGRGQTANSVRTWALRWGWDESKVRRFHKTLEKEGMIEAQGNTKTTIITICKYNTYQDRRRTNDDQTTNEERANDERTTTNNNDNNETTEQEEIHTPELPPDPPKVPKAVKKKYADHVRMTEAEHSKLVAEYGESDTAAFIDRLNTYKGSTGKTYKSDYMTMHSWVIKAVMKDRSDQTKKTGKSNGRTHAPDADDYAILAKRLGID